MTELLLLALGNERWALEFTPHHSVHSEVGTYHPPFPVPILPPYTSKFIAFPNFVYSSTLSSSIVSLCFPILSSISLISFLMRSVLCSSSCCTSSSGKCRNESPIL